MPEKGQANMTTNESYTSADWERLSDALLTSGELVIAASPQSALGMLKERAVYFAELSQLLQNGAAYGLIDELRQRTQARLEQLQRAGFEQPLSFDQVRRNVLERCRSAAQTLMGRADPQEITYFKRGLLWACRQTALAAREGGGFLGIGSVQVTEEESEAIRQIAYALGLPASEAVVDAPPEAPFRPTLPGIGEAFSSEEWNTICLAPLWLSLAMSAASPSGTLGSAKELVAMGRSLQEAALRQTPHSLVATLVNDLLNNRNSLQLPEQPPDPLSGSPASDQVVASALEYCRQAVALVEQKASSPDAIEYKRLLGDLGRQVAGAAREGGVSVSPEEQHLLDELSRILRME
jgi:hypothetical protein